MAEEKKAAAKAAVQTTADNAVYTAAELAGAAQKRFQTNPECVAAALKCAGKDRATIAEAGAIVKAFLQKEV